MCEQLRKVLSHALVGGWGAKVKGDPPRDHVDLRKWPQQGCFLDKH
jgi:hypothetical protein